jgi:putative transcriptional regulator
LRGSEKMKLTPIRLRRLKLGIQSETVIDALNISKSTFYKLEQGWASPSPKVIKKLAEVYECTIDEIFKDLRIAE